MDPTLDHYIQQLQMENEEKDMAIDKAAQIIESLRSDLEKIKRIEKDKDQLLRQRSSRDALQQKVLDLTDENNELKNNLMSLEQEHRIKESDLEEAMEQLESKESELQDINERFQYEKQQYTLEIEQLKRAAENIYRKENKAKRPSVSPDTSTVLTDTSNVSRYKRKQKEEVQESKEQYMKRINVDYEWEMELYELAKKKVSELESVPNRFTKCEIVSTIFEAMKEENEKAMREVEKKEEKVEELSQLVWDLQFAYEHLKKNKENVLKVVLGCFEKMFSYSEQEELEQLMRSLEEEVLPEMVGLGELAVGQFQEVIDATHNSIKAKQAQVSQQEHLRKKEMQHNELLKDQLDILRSDYERLHQLCANLLRQTLKTDADKLDAAAIKASFDLLIAKVEQVEYKDLQVKDITEGNATSIHALDHQILQEQLQIKDLQTQELHKAVKLLQDQSALDKQDSDALRERVLALKTLNDNLGSENEQLLRDLQAMKDAFQDDDKANLEKDFKMLSQDHLQTVSLLENALSEMEQLQQEKEHLFAQLEKSEGKILTLEEALIRAQEQAVLLKEERARANQKQIKRQESKYQDICEDLISTMSTHLLNCLETCLEPFPDEYITEFLDKQHLTEQQKNPLCYLIQVVNQLIEQFQNYLLDDIQFMDSMEDRSNLTPKISQVIKNQESVLQLVSSIAIQKSKMVQNQFETSDFSQTQKITRGRTGLNNFQTVPSSERVETSNFFDEFCNQSQLKCSDFSRVSTLKQVGEKYSNFLNWLSSSWIDQTKSCDKTIVSRLENIVNLCNKTSIHNPVKKKTINTLIMNCFLIIALIKQWKEVMLGNAEIYFEISTNIGDLITTQWYSSLILSSSNNEQFKRALIKLELFHNRTKEIVDCIRKNSLAVTVETHLQQLEQTAFELVKNT